VRARDCLIEVSSHLSWTAGTRAVEIVDHVAWPAEQLCVVHCTVHVLLDAVLME